MSVYWSSGALVVVPVSVVMSWRSVDEEEKLKEQNRNDHKSGQQGQPPDHFFWFCGAEDKDENEIK